ncbi:MAG: ATPase domain-containing protein [Brevundimonas sp.]
MIERFSTGTGGLDELLCGGLLRGSAYIVQGPPGAGKTILANQFCFAHIRGGGRALYMSLLAENHDRMLAYLAPMAFYDPSAVPGALQYVSGYGTLEREGLPGLLKLMHHEIRRHRATAVVLDGVFVAQSNASEAEFRKFVHELQGVANFANATLVMLTHQSRPEGSPEHTMVDGWIELRDELKSFRSYRTIQVRKHRGSAILQGRHPFRITDGGVVVFPRIETTLREGPRSSSTTGRVATGVNDLDRLTHGGWPDASATLVLGPTGAGKTTLGLHFVSQATPEEPALMLGFYETPARLEAKAQMIGLDLKALCRTGALEVIWQPPSENSVDDLAWRLVERAKARKAKRVLLDGVVALRDNLIFAERLPYILNALNAYLRELGAAVLYTSEIREMHSPGRLPTDEVSLIVDNVLLLNYRREEGLLRRDLSILKLRDSGFDPRARQFHIGPRGIAFGSDPQPGDVEPEAG